MTQSRSDGLPDDHFIRQLLVEVEPVGEGAVAGRVRLQPAMWATGTRRPRMAILATFVDIVAGYVPDAPRTPTIDLRVQAVGSLPSEGDVRLLARPLRVGRSLVVSETTLEDASGRVFARATATFKNRPIPGVGFDLVHQPPGARVESFEGMLGIREVDAEQIELEPAARLGNGFVGTVQGGVQALLAECAAGRIAGAGFRAVDLDVRYLDRTEHGPLRARARRLGAVGGRETFDVSLVDAGAGDRLVSCVTIVSQRAVPAGRRGDG